MKRIFRMKMSTELMFARSKRVYFVEESFMGLGYRLRFLDRISNRFSFMDIIYTNIGRN